MGTAPVRRTREIAESLASFECKAGESGRWLSGLWSRSVPKANSLTVAAWRGGSDWKPGSAISSPKTKTEGSWRDLSTSSSKEAPVHSAAGLAAIEDRSEAPSMMLSIGKEEQRMEEQQELQKKEKNAKNTRKFIHDVITEVHENDANNQSNQSMHHSLLLLLLLLLLFLLLLSFVNHVDHEWVRHRRSSGG